MGRHAKTIEEHLRDGTYKPNRHGPIPFATDAVVKLPPMVHEPPAELSQFGREEWQRLYSLISAAGLITEGERQAFANYCRWFGLWKEASQHVNAEGYFVKLKKPNAGGETEGQQYSKWFRLEQEASANMLRAAALCGLTAVDRGRVIKAKAGERPEGVAPKTRPKTALDKAGPLKLAGVS